jgi:hypothetical protein
VLDRIRADMTVIENMVYHRLCLFYKGEIGEAELSNSQTGNIMSDAAAYGYGNWHLYNGRRDRARSIFEKLVTSEVWASFGHIAAEADLARELTNE